MKPLPFPRIFVPPVGVDVGVVEHYKMYVKAGSAPVYDALKRGHGMGVVPRRIEAGFGLQVCLERIAQIENAYGVLRVREKIKNSQAQNNNCAFH